MMEIRHVTGPLLLVVVLLQLTLYSAVANGKMECAQCDAPCGREWPRPTECSGSSDDRCFIRVTKESGQVYTSRRCYDRRVDLCEGKTDCKVWECKQPGCNAVNPSTVAELKELFDSSAATFAVKPPNKLAIGFGLAILLAASRRLFASV